MDNQDENLPHILEVIPTCIMEDHNRRLMEQVSLEEVKKVVFSLGAEKSPRQDGFPALFFQKFWDIMAEDIHGVVEESRKGGFILKYFNNTCMALIPKKAEINSFDDFRPISLCNSIYKINSKVISNRLKAVLDLVISSEQSGFAPGRSIFEGIILAHEVIHSIRTTRTKKMMIKVDIRTAYDEVNRDFLIKVLQQFGFSNAWVTWVRSCIGSPRFLVILNGSPQGFFESTKGIRQGDPLSPFLFIIMAKVLGHFISKKWEVGAWKGVQIAAGVNPITHLQFADDTFLAGDASAREGRVMKETLDIYEKASGQKVNWHKSKKNFFNCKPCKQREICRILGMKVGSLSSKYLGIPFFGGVNKSELWKKLIDSCINKMEGWKSKWLTSAGRILMLKTVVSAIQFIQ